jgi:MurNAc alpha-1-phosphate uridylyltransferase
VRRDGDHRLTYSGLGIYRPQLLQDWRAHAEDAGVDETPPRFRLAPILRAHMDAGRISGEHHRGRWTDVGTPHRLAALDAELSAELAS